MVGFVEDLPTRLFWCAAAQVRENPHLPKVHVCCQAFVARLQAAGLAIHTAQHRDFVAGVTSSIS